MKKYEGKIVLVKPHDPARGGEKHESGCPICDGVLTPYDAYVLADLEPSAYVILPQGAKVPPNLPRDVGAVKLNGVQWYDHETPIQWPTSGRTILYTLGHRAGRLGRLRKAYKAATGQSW